jgi:hypothetical protein
LSLGLNQYYRITQVANLHGNQIWFGNLT